MNIHSSINSYLNYKKKNILTLYLNVLMLSNENIFLNIFFANIKSINDNLDSLIFVT